MFDCSPTFPDPMRRMKFRAAIIVAFTIAAAADADAEKPIRIVLVGDSTVASYDNRPADEPDLTGWGQVFGEFFTGNVTVDNHAKSGRSTRSFIKEGLWKKALVAKGDYIFIQFGHNDSHLKDGKPAVDPATDFQRYLRQYVDESRAIGAKPILVTPVARRTFKDGKIVTGLQPYADAMFKVGKEKGVPVIDLHAAAMRLYDRLGDAGSADLSASANDRTHFSRKGATAMARLVAEALPQAVPELQPYLRTVARHGLQDAIDAAPGGNTKPCRILLKPGRYEGQVIVPTNKNNLELVGETAEKTIVTSALNQYAAFNPGGQPLFNSASFVVLANDFRAENITFENSFGDHGQALAMRVDGDRAVFKHCRLLGWQDTLLLKRGRQYFANCYVEGRVDFIYGGATAIFDHCEIHSKNGGYVTAANTPQNQPFGFVFLDCKLTGDPQPWADSQGVRAMSKAKSKPLAYLGRPWRPYASVMYLNCEMGGHIKPEGWDNWRSPANEQTARFGEYHSTGPARSPARASNGQGN